MSDERPPPQVLIVGAGPIGLEAAVSCRYAGFRVTVAEKGADIASSVRHWKHVRLFSANTLNNSADGLRALAELGCPAPAPTACPTGAEFADGYLEPLARWLAEDADVRLSTRVDSISRGSLLKGDAIKGAGDHARDRTPFAALLVGANGEETFLERLDAVIDCSGTYGNGTQPRRARAECVSDDVSSVVTSTIASIIRQLPRPRRRPGARRASAPRGGTATCHQACTGCLLRLGAPDETSDCA